MSGAGAAVLVTGGAGFIGSHLVERALAEGRRVRVLDDLSSGRESNLSAFRDRIELLRADLRDPAALEAALADVEIVFHQAAVASVPRSVDDPIATAEVNLEASLRLLERARHAGVRRLVFAGSSAVYGDDPEMPKREVQRPCLLSPYAFHKLAVEQACGLYSRLYGLECVTLRYFNVYGPRQDPASDYAAVIPLFVSAAVAGKPVRVFGDGEQTRDFVFVRDVVEANWRAATRPGLGGAVLNVASGRRISVNELVRTVGDCVGSPLEARHEAERAGDVRHSWADVSALEGGLGFRPDTSLERGLRETVEAFRAASAAQKEVA